MVRDALLRNGVEVIMTRESDKKLVIAERCKIANDAGVDYLVSIHANADGDRSDKQDMVQKHGHTVRSLPVIRWRRQCSRNWLLLMA